jgi:hypothetical protein
MTQRAAIFASVVLMAVVPFLRVSTPVPGGVIPWTKRAMTSLHQLPAPCQRLARRAAALDRRSTLILALLFPGAVHALPAYRYNLDPGGRARGQFRPCYTPVTAVGKKAETVAAYLVVWVGRTAPGRGRA